MTAPLAAVVMCAGKGTRMKSELAKVLHPLLGRPMAAWAVQRAFDAGAMKVVPIVGHQAEAVQAALTAAFGGKSLAFALQAEQRGTGHAVQQAKEALSSHDGPVLILSGDVPLITTATLKKLVEAYQSSGGKLALVSFKLANPTGYGRLLREGGQVKRIVEQKDASEAEKKIDELNAGIYCADAKFLFASVAKLSPNNAQGELYLTDVVAMAAKEGAVAVVEADAAEVAGVNDLVELSDRARVLQRRINEQHMKNGVTVQLPETVVIEDGVTIGADSVVGPNVFIGAGCNLGSRVRIGQGSVLTKSTVGDGVEVKPYSVFEEAQVGSGCIIGPFARLRPQSELAEGVHIGNFVETKKARIGKGSKANHLAYLGDAEIGAGCNVGAGTITCNYDGVNKHLTKMGDRVFIGSDSQLVAPVTLGDDVYVGAGSTITEDVPAGALSLSRAPQTTKEGWTERRRKILESMKKR